MEISRWQRNWKIPTPKYLLSAFKCFLGKIVNHIPWVVDSGALDVALGGGEEDSDLDDWLSYA